MRYKNLHGIPEKNKRKLFNFVIEVHILYFIYVKHDTIDWQLYIGSGGRCTEFLKGRRCAKYANLPISKLLFRYCKGNRNSS